MCCQALRCFGNYFALNWDCVWCLHDSVWGFTCNLHSSVFFVITFWSCWFVTSIHTIDPVFIYLPRTCNCSQTEFAVVVWHLQSYLVCFAIWDLACLIFHDDPRDFQPDESMKQINLMETNTRNSLIFMANPWAIITIRVQKQEIISPWLILIYNHYNGTLIHEVNRVQRSCSGLFFLFFSIWSQVHLRLRP